jgi:hypothetical protein
MKKYSCIIVILLAVATSCKKADYQQYNSGAHIQLKDTIATSFSFVYENAAVSRDTIYIDLKTIGGIADHNRTVTVEQVPEYDKTYKYDPNTNKPIDSTVTEKPFKAVPGKHYVPFDDKGMQAIMVVKTDSATGKLPIILLRDTSLKSNSYRLRIRLTASDEFATGERYAIEKTIIFSDRLERFDSWKVDNGTAPAYTTFGKYSTGKHQFMIDVLKVKIDETWFQAVLAAQATSHYKNLLRDALNAFNTDPANIASGKAPVRETSDPNSLAISFPN